MNVQFSLAAFFAVSILVGVSIWSVYYEKTYIEAFNQIPKNIVLVGDSMLENKIYVGKGNSVADVLEKLNNQNNICNYAADGTTISGVYKQLKELPAELNSKNTYLFLSSGGNDIIDKAHKGTTNANIDSIFSDYIKLIETIQTKMGEINIILLNLYFPTSQEYKSYYRMITEWNKKLETFAKEKGFRVLETSNLLTNPLDFVFQIEPSKIGGNKIGNAILSFTN
jgi:lysophospholipase L1-like esterase